MHPSNEAFTVAIKKKTPFANRNHFVFFWIDNIANRISNIKKKKVM